MSMRSLGLLALTLVAGLGTDGRLNAQETAAPPVEAEVLTAPVELDGTALFRVRGVSSLTAEMRASRIESQLTTVASNPAIAVDSLRTVEGDGVTRIQAGDVPIMTIVEADAGLEQVRRVELAETHLSRLRQAVIDYRAARTPAAIRRSAVNLLVATLVLAGVVVALHWFWRLVVRRIHARIRSIEIQSLELMRAERIWAALSNSLLALRTLIFLAIALVYLGFVLAQFPWTRGLSRDLAGFALGPLQVMAAGVVAHIPGLVFLAVLFFVVRLALRLVRLFFGAVGRRTITFTNFDAEWAEPTYKIVRLAIVAFALVVAYPYIPGSDSDAFRGISLIAGIIFSLGSSSAISNLIAGYMLTYRRALKVGDRVKIGDAIGDVIQTRLQATHLRSFKNEEIIIPNSQILASEVLNYSSLAREDHGLILHTEVGIGYETPWRQVESMLIAAAERTPGISKEPRPFILQKRLGDFAVTYELNAYCANVKAMAQLYTALHRNILDVFNEYGVQIMTPAYEGDPDAPKIVPPKDWYTSPATGPTTRPVEPDRSRPVEPGRSQAS
jgi:small-conductance mechanosensitive channel